MTAQQLIEHEPLKVRMRLIHYGSSEYNRKSFRPISDKVAWNKPDGGLWTSPVGSEWGWSDWCKAEDFGDLSKHFELDFFGTVLTIDSVGDLDKFHWFDGGGLPLHVSFTSLCVKPFVYDAIHLTEKGEQATRLTSPKHLYGWDCETVLILNPDSIKQID